MKTKIVNLDKNNIDLDIINQAAKIIKRGGTVAFPTETVYGLGANALNEDAVRSIFVAKGRPSDNPLIVHISDVKQLNNIVEEVNPVARRLMEAFWPGPLTIIMKKKETIPMITTGGLSTVAVRYPVHPVAVELIKASGVPIAAPSANISGKPSPTKGKHVVSDLDGRVDFIIKSDNSEVGVESTVIDTTVEPPMILRPGGITEEQIKNVIAKVDVDPAINLKLDTGVHPKSPGMKYKHYAPKADVIIIKGNIDKVVKKINEIRKTYLSEGKKVGVLATEQTKKNYKDIEVIVLGDRNKPQTLAAGLFSSLRDFDDKNVDIILAEAVLDDGIGFAVMNRMLKAAGFNIIEV